MASRFVTVEGPRARKGDQNARLGDRVSIRRDGFVFAAYLGNRRVGALIVDQYDKSQGEDARYVYKSATGILTRTGVEHVHNGVDLRRQGIGTRLYDAAEAVLREQGLRLVPSPPNVLSSEAWEFWRRRAPELLEANPRKYAPQYVGRQVTHKDSVWTIENVSRGATSFFARRADGVSTMLSGVVVHAVLGGPDEDSATLYLYEFAPERPEPVPLVAPSL